MDGAHRAAIGTREAETEVVVAVRRLVPVAVRRAAVVGVVVPGAAADDPVGARVPSAVDDASVDDPAPQAIGIGVTDMGEQARAAVTEFLQVDPTRLVCTFDCQELPPKPPACSLIQPNGPRMDVEAEEWIALEKESMAAREPLRAVDRRIRTLAPTHCH